MKWTRAVFLTVGLISWASVARAELFDHSKFDEILHRYVDEDGLVDYDGIRQNSLTALDSYFQGLADADMAGWSYDERLAFWIDAYNAHLINFITRKPFVKKVSEDLDIFNHTFKVAGAMLSLNDIEHRILRGTINPDNKKGPIPGLTLPKRDPRIHFALAWGTIGGPRLRPFAYTAENVEDTLYGDAKAFANSAQYVDMANGHLKLSSLLKWYGKDFSSEGGVAEYLSGELSSEKRADADDIKNLLAKDFKKTDYVYDWTVNDQKNATARAAPPTATPLDAPPDASSVAQPLSE